MNHVGMISDLKVIGIKGSAPFKSIVDHFLSLGGDVVLMDPMFVYGKEHVISAVEHAERSFEHGTNRSKTVLTEIIMYAAGERQISKALSKMKPKEGCDSFVAVVLNVPGELNLDKIGMIRDDSIIDGTPEKAEIMGLTNDMGISPEAMALELVALLDVAK